MSNWLRDAEIAGDIATEYQDKRELAIADIEAGNIDEQNAFYVLNSEDADIIVKALMKGEMLDMSQFKDWREQAIEEEMKQRGF